MPSGHRPRPLLLLAGAAAAVALACDDAQPAFPLADQIARAFCARQFVCCSPLEISLLTSDRYTTEQGCVGFATLSARDQLGTIEGAISQKRITVNPERAAECVAAYRDRNCNTSAQTQQGIGGLPDVTDLLALCPDLLAGHVPNGGACNLSQECLHGSHCVAGGAPPDVNGGFAGTFGGGVVTGGTSGSALSPSPGVCVRYQRQGEPCNASSDCDPTAHLACHQPDFVCGAPPQEGEPCTAQFDPVTGGFTGSDCDPTKHLFCDAVSSNVCRRYPTNGQPCSNFSFPQCDPDPALALSCNTFSGICNTPGNEGAACGALAIAPCRADLGCQPTQSDGIGQCGAPPAEGERCSDRCATPAVCAGGLCRMPGAAMVGARCSSGTDCASLLCSTFTSTGQVCSPPIVTPVCAGAGVTPGFPPGVSTGFGGTFGMVGTGGFGGTFVSGTGGRSGFDAGAPGGRPPMTGTAGAIDAGTGGAGGGTPLGCQVSDIAPNDPLIADFTADAGGMVEIPIGGLFTYAAGGGAGPTAEATGGALHVTAMTMGMPAAQYWGVGIYFNGNPTGTDCIDATAHTGVAFDVSGTVGGAGCTLQYATNDSSHTDNTFDPKGAGPPGSYAPQAAFEVTSTPTTIMMPFAGTGAPTGGSPAIPVDKSRLTGVQWQFTTPAGMDQSCTVDITIDNVRFF